MQLTYSPYIPPLLLAALVSSIVAIFAWSRRAMPSAIALALMGLAITVWSIGYTLEIAGIGLAAKLFWGKIQYFGIATAPLFWLVFAFNHANQGNSITQRRMVLLAIVPAITISLALTTEMHGLLWNGFAIVQHEQFSVLDLSHGLWFWVHSAYSYTLLMAGTVIVIRSIGRMKGLYRGQMVALIVALLAPWLGNITYLSGFSPIPDLDITPFAFTITVAALAWGIFGFRLVDIAPVARDVVVETMREGLVVLDNRGRVADINPAASRMIGVPAAHAIGKPVSEVLSPWPHLMERFRDVREAREILTVGQGEAGRRYEVHISPLQDQQERSVGRLITIQDLDAAAVPEPRFASDKVPPPQASADETPAAPASPFSFSRWLADFFAAPLLASLPVPPGVNPSWFQVRERSFTRILRFAALLGTIALFIAPSFTRLQTGGPFAIIIGLIWFLGLARRVDFKTRTLVFLALVYALSFVEMYNFGFSAASFTFFMTLVVSAALLLERRGWMTTFFLAAFTIGTFGILIGQGHYLPISAHEGIPVPGNLQRAMTSTLAFAASGAALLASVTILIESLNQAWRKESQALNLLQQERDLLEQRVIERTGELAEARDQAIKSRDDLRKYFLAMEQSGNTIVITDTKGDIEYVNPKFENLTGYSRAEALGGNPHILKSGEHDVAFYKNLWDTISAGQIWRGEFHNRRKDGTLFWESATIAPVFSESGEITNYVAIKEDITQLKQAYDALSLARDQALEASRLKSQLLSRVSHELRTPLGAIIGYAELLELDTFGPLNEEQKDATHQIVESADYLSQMVNDLLDEAQIESRNMTLNMGFFSPADLLQKVGTSMDVLARNKELDFTIELSPQMPAALYGDERRLQQIIINLVGNAIKFTQQGVVRVRVFQPSAIYWAFQVIDTGTGIPKDPDGLAWGSISGKETLFWLEGYASRDEIRKKIG